MHNKDLKIVFFGTPDFAVTSLKTIVENGYNVVGVVTATDKMAGRGHKLSTSPVKNFALSKGLKILQPEKLKDPVFIEELKSLEADLFVVIAFRMLPEIVWKMPPLGTFNLHASLLPKYRGAAPINHAIINGESKSGVTTFFLQQEIDTGDIIDRVEVEICDTDDAGTLHDKLMDLGAELTLKTITAIAQGSLKTVPQDELIEKGSVSCPAPKIFKDTGNIDWNKTADVIHNLVRGLSPHPGAWTLLKSDTTKPVEVKIFKTKVIEDKSNLSPGTVVVEGNRMMVACKDSFLEILELQPAGKKRMTTDAFLRGARLLNPQFEYKQN